MLNNVKKHCNKTNNCHANQQLIGHNYVFTGVKEKEWVMGNKGRIDFHQQNKVLVQICIQCYHECWKRRCVVLHDLEVRITLLKDEVLNILEDASKEEVEELKTYVELHTMNVNNASVDEIMLWVRSVRVFKRKSGKSVHQDMRSIMNVIVI